MRVVWKAELKVAVTAVNWAMRMVGLLAMMLVARKGPMLAE